MKLQMGKLVPLAGESLYQALARNLKTAVNGLPAHSQLPSIRQLAKDTGFNPSTVVAALQVLSDEGLVYRRAGSGTYLSPSCLAAPISEETILPLESQPRIDFAAGSPSPEYFPIEDFKQAFNTVLDRDRGQAFLYPEPNGYLPLRLSIVDYLRARGMLVSSDDVQITSGAQQAISLLCQTLLVPGDAACIESPTYPGAIQALHASGAKLIPIPLGQQGPSSKSLQLAAKAHPRLYYAIPNFQNPTGVCYGPDARRELVQLAREHDFYIVEDDHVSELYYAGNRPQTLWQDAPDRVLYVKSFSKLFMPGLRLGFMILPTQLQAAVSHAKHAADLGSPGINQRVLDVYLRSGRWQSYQEFLRRTYKDRAQVMQQALQRNLGNLATCYPSRGGMNFWLTFPASCNAMRLQQSCVEAGLLISPGSDFSLPGHEFQHSVRLSIASVFPDQIEQGIRILGNRLERMA